MKKFFEVSEGGSVLFELRVSEAWAFFADIGAAIEGCFHFLNIFYIFL